MTAPPIALLPPAWAQRAQARLAQLAPQRMIERLWRGDASLWTNDAGEQAAVGERLGWLSVLPAMASKAADVSAFAQAVRRDGFTHALVLGMGGSSLFAEVCRGLFPSADMTLSVLDSTDPALIQATVSAAPLDRTLFVVVSKSGSTLEVSALFDYFYDQARLVCGEHAGKQFVVITDDGTPLAELARQRRVRQVFVHGPGTGLEVGGRFSAVTYFGLVPAALLGADLSALLSKASAALAQCGPAVEWSRNSAALLAAALAEAAADGRDKVTLLSAPALAAFEPWVEQLVAESTGKGGQGLVPILGEEARAPSQYPKDRVFVAVQSQDAPDAGLARRVDALAAAGHPVIQLTWPDREAVMGEAMRWFVATVLLGAALRVNPFDEPNVQESKDRTKAILERYLRVGEWPAESSATVRSPEAYTPAVRDLLARGAPGGYVAVLSYLPRTPQLDAEVLAFRARLAALTPAAVAWGWGPRYLHSTGQLHKGGPAQASFIFLTAEDPLDVPVPGRGYGFGALKRAQALGDVQALRERGRTVLRLHLGNAPLDALQRMLRT